MTEHQRAILEKLVNAPNHRLTRLALLKKLFGTMDHFEMDRAMHEFPYVQRTIEDKTVFYSVRENYRLRVK